MGSVGKMDSPVPDYQPRYRNSWALIIGINAYQDLNPLNYAVNDAQAVYSLLTTELGFPPDKVTLLLDGDATRQAILDTWLELTDKAADPDDRVIMFFAGHGMTVQGAKAGEEIGCLVPVDGDIDKRRSLIRWDELLRTADMINAKHAFFIMDACYSGLAFHRAVPPGTQRFLSDMLQRFSRQVITAGKADQTVADGGGPQGKNSIFTGHLIEGLRGGASDANGVLTASALMHYVYEKVSKNPKSQQTPHYGHIEGDGDFVLRVSPMEDLFLDTLKTDQLVAPAPEMPETPAPATPPVQTFSAKRGYLDPIHPSFGRNEWSDRLGERRYGRDVSDGLTKAFCWVSFIMEPSAPDLVKVDLDHVEKWLPPLGSTSTEPYERFRMPFETRTTLSSTVWYDFYRNESDLWARYVWFDKGGNLEYADSSTLVFHDYNGQRRFYYVQLVGLFWQFIRFGTKALLHCNYRGGVRLWANLVGTRDTILVDFSQETGKDNQRWRDPTDREPFFEIDELPKLTSTERNIQLEYSFVVSAMKEPEGFDLVKDFAAKLGRAYNHNTSPRCFNYETDTFPWNQFWTRQSGRR